VPRALGAVLAALAAVLLGALPSVAAVPHAAAAGPVLTAGSPPAARSATTSTLPEAGGDAKAAVHQAVQTLNSGDPVYVSPKSDTTIRPGDSGRIRKAIASHPNTPVYVAVLPKLSARKGGAALQAIKDAVDAPGVYVLASGRVWGYVVHGGELPSTAAKPLSSYVHHHKPTPGHMVAFIHKVQHFDSDRAATAGGSQQTGGVPASGIAGIIALGLILVGFVGFVLARDRHRGKRNRPTSPETSTGAK
jgi:hypothetical protein